MKVFIATLFVLMFSQPLLAQNTGLTMRLAFDDLPRLVRDKNENVQAAQSTLKADKKRTGYLARSFLPQISADYGGEEFKAGREAVKRQNYWKVGAQLNLYRGGQDRIENSVRETNVRIAQTSYANEYQQELKEARQAYWKLVAITKLINDKKEAAEKNESNFRSARKRTGAGVATNADSLQFELKKTLLSQELKQLQLQQDLLKNKLSVAIGLDEHKNLEISSEFPHPEDAIKLANLNPKQTLEVKILTEQESVIKLKRDQSSRWWLPRIDAYSSYGLPSLSDEYTRALTKENEWNAGLRMTLNLGESFEMQNEAGARAQDAAAIKLRAAHKERETIAMDHELRHDLTLMHELIHDADKDVSTAEKFLKLTEDEYRRGVKNGPDLLMAFQQLYDFRQRRTDLYRNYYETFAELLALLAQDEA